MTSLSHQNQMSAWNVECYLWGCKEKRQVENYDFGGQMDIGSNPSSQMQCRASSLLSEPLLFFKRGREKLTLQSFRAAKLNEMFTALWKVFDAQKMLRPFWLHRTDLVLQLWKKVKVKTLSRVWLFATPWSVAHQAPLSMGFSRQEYWSGLPFPSPADLPHPGIELRSPALQADALLSELPGNLLQKPPCSPDTLRWVVSKK